MALDELRIKEALRMAADWLTAADPPGAAAAREGIANVIPLVIMGEVSPADIDDLAAIVEKHGQDAIEPGTALEVHRARLKEAVKAAFDQVKSAG